MIFDEKFWLAVAFVVFILLVLKLAGKTILNLLDAKSNLVKKTIDDAKKAKEEAEKLLENAKKYNKESKSYADKLIAEATKEADKLAQEAKEEIESEITKKTATALKRIEVEQEIAIKEVKKRIVKTALETLSKSFKSDITDKEQEKLLTKANSDLEEIL